MAAAPNSSYLGRSLKHTKGTTTIDCLIAIPDATEAVLKARFYLDKILAYQRTDGAVTTYGFIGACIKGSPNHAMHNVARQFTLDNTKDADTLDFFNDAGLNTLAPRPDQPIMLSQNGGYFSFRSMFKPSFYDSSLPEFEYRIKGSGDSFSSIATPSISSGRVNGEVKETRTSHYFRWVDLVTPKTIEFRAINRNPEGFTETILYEKVITSNDIRFIVVPTDQYGNIGTEPQFSMGADSWDLVVGTVIDAPQLKPNMHFIVVQEIDDEDNENYGQVYHTNDGVPTWQIVSITAEGAGDPEPSNIFVKRFYAHRTTNSITQCSIMNGGGYSPPTTFPVMYRHIETGRFYEGENVQGNVASDGYYFNGGKVRASNDVDSWEFYQLVDGYLIAQGNCYDGIAIT